MVRERSPGVKLLLVGLVAFALMLPLVMVYALVGDRETQSMTAQQAITAGWGGSQVVSGPVVAIPYLRNQTQIENVNGTQVTRTSLVRDELFLSPKAQSVETNLVPDTKKKSIYSSVIYRANLSGKARFELPDDLGVRGVKREDLMLDEAELRFGVSDPRGLQNDAKVSLQGKEATLQPGKGVASSGNAGFFSSFDWNDGEELNVEWSYGLRGSRSIALVPRGGNTDWTVTSPWPHPGFGGGFLPDSSEISDKGFTAKYGIPNLALGQSLVLDNDPGMPSLSENGTVETRAYEAAIGATMAASIGLVEPVDLYSQVDRSVKYGFLFIGFTFLAFLMFDIVGGARVAAAEYIMTGAGLVLFFVLLLAFSEVVGFALAYVAASAAIIGLLTAYSAAVLKSWRRARFIGALLVGLYGLIYVLLSLEAFSLMIGSLLLFAALAGVMYATRNVEWSNVGQRDQTEGAVQVG